MTPDDRDDRQRASAADRSRLAVGRLAGLLFAAGAVAGSLAEAALPARHATALPISPGLLALATAAACLLAPWQRLASSWLHLLPAVASALTFATVAGQPQRGLVFGPLYCVAGAFAAYAFRSRAAIGAHVAVAAAFLAAPLAYGGVPASTLTAGTAVQGTAVVAVAGLLVAVRERMEAGRHALRELAQSDGLTGIGNYRRLHGRLAYELSRHRRSGRRLALLVLDLDGFKQVNDRAGHPAGDRVLRAVAAALQDVVREQDTVARQGGDEFAVLAPETDAAAAATLAARVERALDAVDVDGLRIGASVGWAIYPDDGEEQEELLRTADARQRDSKRARRAWRTTGRSARLSA